MGFPRRTLAFLKALVHILICSSYGQDHYYRTHSQYREGVRQGCPLSGLLFNLFINDILDGVAPSHSSLDYRETPTPSEDSCTQTICAVFADSEQSLLAASTTIEQWVNWWEMQFGVAKCGIISFTGHLAPRLDTSIGYSTPWTVGQLVRSPALVLVSSDQAAIQEQILADTTSQTKDSQATTLVCIDGDLLQICGDSASLQKYVTRQLLDTSGFFKDSSFRSIASTWHKISDACAYGCTLGQARKAIQIGILVDTHPFSVRSLHIMRPATTQHIHCSSRGGV
ncbi:hypothetical protein BASA81_010649 [Batrachochytrium salamandrivorans]|nr:hypothetical protein BASA81_010649 [Batrachochytrium salamandrivorans]